MEVDSGSMLRIVQCLMAFLVLGPVIVTLANGKFHAIEKLHIRTLIHLGNLAGSKIPDIEAVGSSSRRIKGLAMDGMDNQAALGKS